MKIVSGVVFAALCVGGAAWGHGPQIQISRDALTGQIVTRQIVDTTLYHEGLPGLTPVTKVYVMPMLPAGPAVAVSPTTIYQGRPDQTTDINHLYSFSGPGISYQFDSSADGNLPGTNWAFSGSGTLPNLQGSAFGYELVSGLQLWNGSAFVDAGATQVMVSRGSGTSLVSITSSDSGTRELDFASIATYAAGPHQSATFTLLGDGINAASASDDGVYRLQLEVVSNAPGVLPSEPVDLLWSKNASPGDVAAAVASLGVPAGEVQSAIPEPGAAAALLACPLALLARRRRR